MIDDEALSRIAAILKRTYEKRLHELLDEELARSNLGPYREEQY
jgi:hypothetical protein